MSFRDKISALVAEDRREVAQGVLDELDETLNAANRDIKELKAKLRDKDGVKPEDLERLEAENAELKKQLADSTAASKKSAKERDEAIAARTEIEGQVNRTTAETEIRKQLSALGITGDRLDELVEGYVPRTSVKVADGARIAYIGDKPASEFFPEWAKGRGKEFIPAAGATGSGAVGVRAPGTAVSLETQYAEAHRRGDIQAMMALKESMQKQ